jgi:predicted dehydrogenase
MVNRIRWGVIGSGGIARRRTIPEGIIPARNAELVAVFDVDPKVNAEVAQQFKAKAAPSINELLTAGIDAVYLATPANRHHQQVLQAAQARRHVLCEKPLGMTVPEGEEMIAACSRAGVQLGCGFMMRFQSQNQKALKLIQEGKLGRPVYGRAQLSCWYPPIDGAWRQDPARGGGGSLMDMGGHCIDLLEMFFGAVRKVSCSINRTVHPYASEDSAVATLFFANGALATVDTFFCIPDESSQNVLELYGSRGSILAKGTISQASAGEMRGYLKVADGGYDAQQTRASDSHFEIPPEPVNIYRAEIEEFSQAILDGRPTTIRGELGLQSQIILSACYESAKTGKAVEIISG